MEKVNDYQNNKQTKTNLPNVLVIGPPKTIGVLKTTTYQNHGIPTYYHQNNSCLKLVVTKSSGTDHIDLSVCKCRGIRVANLGSLYSEDVADVAVALLIGVVNKIYAADRFVRTNVLFNFPYFSNSKVCLVSVFSFAFFFQLNNYF